MDNAQAMRIFNRIESYYSKSLKTDDKKQFRTNKGIENQIKLAEMKRLNLLKKPEKSLMEFFRLFTPLIYQSVYNSPDIHFYIPFFYNIKFLYTFAYA